MAVKKVTAEAQQEEAAPKAVKKFEVMLVNGAKRYAYKETLYESGVKYAVDEDTREELFSRTDDNGVRYFMDAAQVEASVKRSIRARRGLPNTMEVSPAMQRRMEAEVLAEGEEDRVVDTVAKRDARRRASVTKEDGEIDTAGGAAREIDV